MLGTGMRRREALGLRWEAIDFPRSRLAVVGTVVVVGNKPCFSAPKTPESRRVVHLDGPVLAAMRGQRKRQAAEQLSAGPGWRESGLVFTSMVGGMLDPHNARRTFDAAIAKADLPPIRLHDLRHTFATLALGAGAHPKQVQEMLGHADVSITLDIYAHVTDEMHRDAAERRKTAVYRRCSLTGLIATKEPLALCAAGDLLPCFRIDVVR
jgi:integrase